MLHAVPPMTAPDVITSCKQLVNETGFVDVDTATLRHKKYSNVFAIGDVACTPNSKTAAAAGKVPFWRRRNRRSSNRNIQ